MRPTVRGVSSLLPLADARFVSLTTFRRTYPIESRIVLGIERLIERLRGRPRTTRLALLIT